MADVPDLRLVPNCCGGMSLVYEGRAYKLKRSGKQKYWKYKKGCGGAIWTNLDVTSVSRQNDHIESCPVDEHLAYKMEKKALLKKLSAEETKPISAIYDEEASFEPSTSGCFPLCKRVKSTMYSHRSKQYPKLPNHRRDVQIPVPFKTTKADEDFLLWHMDGTFKVGINNCLPSVPLWWISWCQQSTVDVRVKILERTALIPAIQGYFLNKQVKGCYFHFCQAVHRKVGELGLKTRYRTEEGTRRKIRMLLATAFLPVPQVDTDVRLLEAGTTGSLSALFQYFRWKWMTDERLSLRNVHHGVMDTLIQQMLSGNATVGDLRRVNKVYAEKQQRVAQYTGEYTNGSRTLEQFLEALMYITPEPI
ncbi:hypothetical protein T06_4744 [Trichinella sp. T6]|nr:hypothetical protein T06_4744 [Trichinella sp. T6]